jgi:ABC-2 type transport system ATP-binding protein
VSQPTVTATHLASPERDLVGPATIEVVDRAGADQPPPRSGGPTAISTRGLTKRFPGGQVAVDSLDLDVPTGSVFGFLGPNGSGKTTSIRMLLGLVSATDGRVELLGSPMPDGAAHVLPRVGALVEGPGFHPYLSGRDNLLRLDAADRTVTNAGARRRVAEALDRVGLAAAEGKRYRAYSMGMRQRLGLAAALLKPRDLLVLDEPTNGLDPQGTREVRSIIRDVGAGGTTVFLSSHLLPEVEQVCSHVGVMSHGRLVFSGSLGELRQASVVRIRVDTERPAAAAAVLHQMGTGEPDIRANGVVAELRDAPSERLVEALVRAGIPVRQLVLEQPDLEEMFVELTGEGFDVDE